MTPKTNKIFIIEIYSKPPRKNHATKKADVYHIDDIRLLDILELKDYGAENNREYRYVLVIIDIFSKYGWTVPLEIKNAKMQKQKNSFENMAIKSKENQLQLRLIGERNLITVFVKICWIITTLNLILQMHP